MGEVWRARDERLKREVAVKVLPKSYEYSYRRLLFDLYVVEGLK